jgi:hypothetical protein
MNLALQIFNYFLAILTRICIEKDIFNINII